MHQRDAPAGDDALRHRRSGGRQGILDPVLELGQLRVGRCTHLDHGHLARQGPDAFAEHLLVDPERRALQLGAQLGHPELDLVGRTGAVDDRRAIRIDPHLPGATELLDRHRLEGEAGVLAVDLATGDRGDVFELAQPPVSEPRGLGRDALEHAVDVVVHQHAQSRALDGLGDDHQWLRCAHHLVQQRHDLLHLGDLLAAQQDVGIVEDRLEAGRMRHEVRRQVAVVVLEALDEVDADAERGRLLHRHDPAVPDGVQRLGQHRTDHLVVVGRDGGHPGVVRRGDDRVGGLAQVLDEPADRQDRCPA